MQHPNIERLGKIKTIDQNVLRLATYSINKTGSEAMLNALNTALKEGKDAEQINKILNETYRTAHQNSLEKEIETEVAKVLGAVIARSQQIAQANEQRKFYEKRPTEEEKLRKALNNIEKDRAALDAKEEKMQQDARDLKQIARETTAQASAQEPIAKKGPVLMTFSEEQKKQNEERMRKLEMDASKKQPDAKQKRTL